MSSQKSGSVKEIIFIDDDTLEFEFTDRISIFDKLIPSTIPGKGTTLCNEGVFWFQKVENLDIKTHFIKQVAPNRMRVKRVRIIRDYNKIDTTSTNYLIPLEFIARHYVAGSLYERVKKKNISAEALGFKPGHVVTYGEKLPTPYIETSTKLEAVDRLLDKEEALAISGLTEKEYTAIFDAILKIDELIEHEVSKRGLIHVDGKKEFAFDGNRELMVIDVFGTADEDRFWDRSMWENGECVEMSKEFVRKYYELIGYKEALYKARDEKAPEPDMPVPPDELIEQTVQLYKLMQYKIMGVE